MPQPLATIAFVPREQFCTTQRSLETLYERTSEPFELVCVDGGSPPEVRDYLERAAKERNFTLLRTESFLTPNQARNLAAAHVKTRYVVFMDNDVLASPGFLAPLVDCARATGAWVVGPLYFEFKPECHRVHMFGGQCRIDALPGGGNDYVEIHRFAHQTIHDIPAAELKRQETELIEFHTVLVDMEAFHTLGPLDEGLLSNAEHGDLCLQVRNAGRRVFLEPASKITYAPPSKLTGVDLDFFRLRWSEAWSQATRDRLREKWNLAPDCAGLKMSQTWAAGHRRFASPTLHHLRRIIGRKPTRWLEKHAVGPLESAANRKQYPAAQYGHVSPVEARLVHAPQGSFRIAA